jgi:hypothetical protein
VTAMTLPLRTAREIPTLGSKGDPVETRWRCGCVILTVLALYNHWERRIVSIDPSVSVPWFGATLVWARLRYIVVRVTPLIFGK